MARFSANMLGVIGSIGPVVVSSRNGKPYLKGPYKDRTKKITAREKDNRIRFRKAQEWLQPLLDVLRQGYNGRTGKGQQFIAAKSWLMKHAMSASGEIDPSKMKISDGELPVSQNISVAASAGQLHFTWDPSPIPKSSARDQAFMLAYDVEHNHVYWDLAAGFRHEGQASLKVTNTKNPVYHVWVAFVTIDRTSQSDSVYMGSVKM